MDTLPPELLRYLIPFLPLTSLIAARGVSKKWRCLALTASLHPARKALLDLYLAAIVHPNFPSLIKALQPHLHEFDREEYISTLTSRGCVLPDIFELWILEWPSKAVHFWAWPGLERYFPVDHDYFYEDGNALSEDPPAIETIPVPMKDVATVGSHTCLGLELFYICVWSSVGSCRLWLVVDANESINDRRTGRLVWTYSDIFDPPGSCTPGPKRILRDTPFGPRPPTDFKLIDFLDMLDVSYDLIDHVLRVYCSEGIASWTDGDE